MSPVLPGILPDLPPKLRSRLYQAFDLQLLYKHDTHQVTIRTTITTSTPDTVDAIINDSHTPAPPVQTSDVPLQQQPRHDRGPAPPGRGRGSRFHFGNRCGGAGADSGR